MENHNHRDRRNGHDDNDDDEAKNRKKSSSSHSHSSKRRRHDRSRSRSPRSNHHDNNNNNNHHPKEDENKPSSSTSSNKRYKHHHQHDDSSQSSASSILLEDRRHSKKKKHHHRKEKKRKQDGSSKSDGHGKKSSTKKRKKKKEEKKKKKHDKQHKEKKKNRRSSSNKHHDDDDDDNSSPSRSRSPSRSPSPSPENTAPPGAHELATALTNLFHSYPSMISLDEGGIPLLLIQLSRGTEYNLGHMPDRNLARLLGGVFESLRIHGMEQQQQPGGNGSGGAWKWGNATPSGRKGDDLALLRVARALLSGVGFTMGAVEGYERDIVIQRQQKEKERMVLMQQLELEQRQKQKARLATTLAAKEDEETVEKQQHHEQQQQQQQREMMENDVKNKKRVERMASQLLDRFDPRNSSSTSSSSSSSALANELQGICDILLEGESVQLDGIENDKLKATLAQLFQLVGLELVEMDEEDDDDDDEEKEECDEDKVVEGDIDGKNNAETSHDKDKKEEEQKAMGYALPEHADLRDTVASYLNEVLRVCRFRSSDGKEGVPKSWVTATNNPSSNNGKEQMEMESSSDEDEGPAPLGTMAAVKISKRQQRQPKLTDPNNPLGEKEEGGREEWMMVPGEHDFLKGIQASISKSTAGRTFKNERNRGQAIASNSNGNNNEPINPKVLAEVNAIQQAYEQSRGPSLLDAHRQQQQELKEQQQQQQQGQKDKVWSWSKDKNLDDGRRVDKNALHFVLGGASTELKSKFQGGVGR